MLVILCELNWWLINDYIPVTEISDGFLEILIHVTLRDMQHLVQQNLTHLQRHVFDP